MEGVEVSPTWDCPLCAQIFPIHLVEDHIRFLHIGAVRNDWVCGECAYRSDVFNDVAAHCIVLRHDPTAIRRSEDLDSLLLSLLHAIQEGQPASPRPPPLPNSTRKDSRDLADRPSSREDVDRSEHEYAEARRTGVFPCHLCKAVITGTKLMDESFAPNVYGMRGHTQAFHLRGPHLYGCPVCPQSGNRQSTVLGHIRKKHPDQPTAMYKVLRPDAGAEVWSRMEVCFPSLLHSESLQQSRATVIKSFLPSAPPSRPSTPALPSRASTPDSVSIAEDE